MSSTGEPCPRSEAGLEVVIALALLGTNGGLDRGVDSSGISVTLDDSAGSDHARRTDRHTVAHGCVRADKAARPEGDSAPKRRVRRQEGELADATVVGDD